MYFNVIKVFVISLFLTPTANATTLYFDPSPANFGPGDSFGVNLKINNEEGECINAGEVQLKFPKDKLQLEDFSTGESLFSLWIEKPSKSDMERVNADGLVKFSGGIPGGYCGRVPGDPGDSNIVGKLFFKVLDAAEAGEKITLQFIAEGENKTAILLNDGFGTYARLNVRDGEVVVGQVGQKKEELKDLVNNDQLLPESFVVELSKDMALFNNQYFIMFSTTDKQSGLDRFEVQEIPLEMLREKSFFSRWLARFFRQEKDIKWKTASSPYKLEDQNLNSQIKVKAVDKAGNERIVDFIPEGAGIKKTENKKYFYLMLVGLGAILLIAIYFLMRKKIKKATLKS